MRTQVSVQRKRHRPQLLQYLVMAVVIIATLMLVKGAIAWAAEAYLYPIPIVGGLLQSLEILEVSNVLVFALLGMGLGAITLWLPAKWGTGVRAIALVIAIPLVFLSSYVVRQHLWVQRVAQESELLPQQAEQVTSEILHQATGNAGLLGFFHYTVRSPILPTDLGELQGADLDDKWFRSELTRYSGVEPGLFSLLFRLTGWGIRVFYIVLSAITAAIYFSKGIVWAETTRLDRSTN